MPSKNPNGNTPASPNGQAPQDASFEDFDLRALYDFNGVTLEDEILLSMTGRTKSITKGNGDTISVAPGLKGTLTNVETGETFDFVATGSIHTSPNDDGTELVTLNGLNLLGNPYVNDGSYALTQSRGHFSYTFDGSMDPPWGPLDGSGQILFIVEDMLS